MPLAGDLEAPARLARRPALPGLAPARVGVADRAPAAGREVAVLHAEAHLQPRAALAAGHRGADADLVRMRGGVAHVDGRPQVGVVGARGRRGDREEQREDEGEACHRRNQHRSSVMDAAPRRSTDVTSTLTLPLTATRSHPVLDFDTLYRAARDDVYAYVATLLGDRSAAEDVTASAFERAFLKQGTYKPARGSERAWLFGIARNAALDELRRRKRSAALTAEPADADAAAPEDAADTALRRAALRTALAGAGAARARADRAQVPRRPGQRRAGHRPRRLRLQRGHDAAPRRHEAAKGHR